MALFRREGGAQRRMRARPAGIACACAEAAPIRPAGTFPRERGEGKLASHLSIQPGADRVTQQACATALARSPTRLAILPAYRDAVAA